MKILNICMGAPFTEGYSYQDNLLSEYQHKLGHDVTVLTGTHTRGENGGVISVPPCDKMMKNGVRLIRIYSGSKLRRFIGYYPDISKIIRTIAPDMIFVHGLCSFVPVQCIAYKKKHPNVCLVADNHQDERNTKLAGFPFLQIMGLWRLCWKYWIGHFAHIYGTTSWRKDFAVKYFGIPREKADTLFLGVDTDRLPVDVDSTRKEIRKNLGLDNDDFVFVCGGKLNAQKRTVDIMRAFSGCTCKKVKLLMFGSVDTSIRAEFDAFREKDSRIIYTGFLNSQAISRYFMASDFGVFPASHSVLWEEAIGCGLPCLFGRFGDHDHTQVCDNCIQIDTDASIEDIGNTLSKVAGDESFYKKLKENALAAAPEFSYYDIARKSIES